MTRPPDAAPFTPTPAYRRRMAHQSQTARRNAPVPVSTLGMVLARCEFCHGPIVWAREVDNPRARTPEGKIGKLVPIDPEPSTDPRANLALSAPSEGYVPGVTAPGDYSQPRVGELSHGQLAGYRAAGKPTMIRHVRTCTHADELRRGAARRHGRR